MTWKKFVLVLTVVIALILTLVSVRPADVLELQQPAGLRLYSSDVIPLNNSFDLKGFAVSGYWEGSGRALVWISGSDKKYLVLDTAAVPKVFEFSSFGSKFQYSCVESCSFPSMKVDHLLVYLSGPGFLTIDSYHLAVPVEPTGFLSYPRIFDLPSPNHALLLIVLLLLISILGAHTLGHYVESVVKRRIIIMVFLGGFIALGSVFGVTLAVPASPFSVITKQLVTVFAAFAIIALFVILALEILGHRKLSEKPDVWKDLEEAEEKWEKK